jgi:hypothetical protein
MRRVLAEWVLVKIKWRPAMTASPQTLRFVVQLLWDSGEHWAHATDSGSCSLALETAVSGA